VLVGSGGDDPVAEEKPIPITRGGASNQIAGPRTGLEISQSAL